MNTAEALVQAAGATFREQQSGQDPTEIFLRKLGAATIELDQPTPASRPFERITYAILNQQAPDRKAQLQQGIAEVQQGLVAGAALLHSGIDAQVVVGHSAELSRMMIEGVATVAATYPAASDLSSLKTAFGVAYTHADTPQGKATTALVTADLLTPFVTDRLLQVDWSNKTVLQEEVAAIASDVQLLRGAGRAVKPAIDRHMKGDASGKSEAEVAEQLFTLGPLFAKSGQALAGVAEGMSSSELAQFAAGIGRALQEGIAPPSDAQRAAIASELPAGLQYNHLISSASIGHVIAVSAPEGDFATKVKRPQVVQAIEDNARIYQLTTDILSAYTIAHAEEGAFTKHLQIVTEALPFGLEVIKADAKRELDYEAEARAQHQARTIFEKDTGVVVPKVIDAYSDADHITMEYLPAQRIEDLPANSERLKNIFVFALRSWKEKLVHADLHPGNIKSREDGTLVVYDWAKPIHTSPGFLGNLARFVLAMGRGNPNAVARAYKRVQSPDHGQAPREAIAAAFRSVVAEEQGDRKGLRKGKRIQRLLMALGIQQQSTLAVSYISFMRTAVAFGGVVKSELDKPLYQDRRQKYWTILKSFSAAAKDVYWTKR